MSDFLRTNWVKKIQTDPIVNRWAWQDVDGNDYSFSNYTFQKQYISSNTTDTKLIGRKGNKKPTKKKKKK